MTDVKLMIDTLNQVFQRLDMARTERENQQITANFLMWRQLLKDDRCSNRERLEQFGAKCYSQNDEDGIVIELFRRIGTTSKRFVEFGVENGTENGTLLWFKQARSGLGIDESPAHARSIREQFSATIASRQLTFIEAMITGENIEV